MFSNAVYILKKKKEKRDFLSIFFSFFPWYFGRKTKPVLLWCFCPWYLWAFPHGWAQEVCTSHAEGVTALCVVGRNSRHPRKGLKSPWSRAGVELEQRALCAQPGAATGSCQLLLSPGVLTPFKCFMLHQMSTEEIRSCWSSWPLCLAQKWEECLVPCPLESSKSEIPFFRPRWSVGTRWNRVLLASLLRPL